jgi:hypothetical protein
MPHGLLLALVQVERQCRRLDVELGKFQADLEASKPGITESLRAQSTALDAKIEAERAAQSARDQPKKRNRMLPVGKFPSMSMSAELPLLGDARATLTSRGRPGQPLGLDVGGSAGMGGGGGGGGGGGHHQMSGGGRVPRSEGGTTMVPITAVAPEGTTQDPNEPRYCVCNQVSFGDMVGCENENCPNGEWFHYACVGLTEEPKGKWFCTGCDPKRRKAYR